MARPSNVNVTPGSGKARIRANSAAAAKAVAPKKPKGPVKVLTPIKGSGPIKINTNPKPVVVKAKKVTPPTKIKPSSAAEIKRFNQFVDSLVAAEKAAQKSTPRGGRGMGGGGLNINKTR